jgi:drug/metabolite transporter (DMT)-like permease
MTWLIVIISAYFLFALVALGDKYLLAGPPNPRSYSFYVGALGILSLLLIPFVGFSVPDIYQVSLALLVGAIYIFALFGLFTGLENFEASRVVPAIGGLLPLFTFGLVYLFSYGKELLSSYEILAFILLLTGSIFITFEKGKPITSKSLQISAITAFLFALAFVLTKYVYLAQPFWSGFIWMRIGGFLIALCFIFTKEVKREIFERKFTFQKKTGTFFLFNQAMGGGAFVLQNWAIALVPLGSLALISALEGTKYIFLLILAVLLSLKFPQILKEEISKKIFLQKIIAILLIGGGLVLLAIK